MARQEDIEITPYDERTRAGLRDLYLHVACQGGGIARLPHEITNDYASQIFLNTMDSGLGFSAINQNEDVIGDIHAEFPSISIFRRTLWNLTIAVHPDYQGLGIGTRLCRSLIDEARKLGTIKRIELFCREDNHYAVRFYEKLGFQTEGILTNRLFVDGAYSNDLVMGYLLDPLDSSLDLHTSEPA